MGGCREARRRDGQFCDESVASALLYPSTYRAGSARSRYSRGVDGMLAGEGQQPTVRDWCSSINLGGSGSTGLSLAR